MAARQPARPRRIDDALSQLVDSLLPPLLSSQDDLSAQNDEELVAIEERRHVRALERAWRIVDTHTSDPDGGPDPDLVNNASDLIKRKLLRENPSPDKAVRFSNLYSRLLTQPVLGQKWAILYLIWKLGAGNSQGRDEEVDGYGGLAEQEREMVFAQDYGATNTDVDEPREAYTAAVAAERDPYAYGRRGSAAPTTGPRSRSPLMDEDQLDNMLGERRRKRAATVGAADEAVPKNDGAESNEKKTARGSHQADGAVKDEAESGDNHQQSSAADAEGPHAIRPPESALLRDLPFNLQGLSSANLEFASASTIKLPHTLPVPIISLLHTLAEPCLLYRGLADFVEGNGGGLMGQSLRAAIGKELRSYLGLVATLEGEIRRALSAVTDPNEPKGVVKAGVTLKRCVVWTREATMALRLMSLMVEESKGKKGGQLISMIHGFSSSHGDPFVGAFAERFLAHITRPFYDMLRQWIYDGELSDPYQEFFVVEPEARPSADPRKIATSVWEDKYKLDDGMVPSIITQDFAKKVFLIGKSLNFIRYGCGDSAWVEAYSKEASKELRYGDTATLETSIDEAYKTTMARLIYLMDSKFKLFEHLKALKKYLLLGQGDFIALLMESLASNLDRPANSQYRHTLTAQLEHAIRASNAQYDSPDVLRRLDARMLELSHGEIGWDCFTLEYKIDAPVDVVITPWGSTQYLKVFNFLWRVKRVEFALGSTWRRCMTGARGVLGSVEDEVGADWKRARCVVAEMIHFVNQLQYYILFEVIEASWDQLQAAISKPGCTLDDLIEAHTRYLNSITHKGLLGSSSRGSSSVTGSKEDSFLAQLHQVLKIMLAYKDVVDGLYSYSVAEFTRRQEFNAKIETRTAQGKWGVTERDLLHRRGGGRSKVGSVSSTAVATPTETDPDINPLALDAASSGDHMLPSLRKRLQDLSVEFRSRLSVLLGDLAYQPDVDMRFLGVVMNFNDVYEPVRRRRAAAVGSGAAREKERERRRKAAAAANVNVNGGGEKLKEREREAPVPGQNQNQNQRDVVMGGTSAG